MISEGMVDEGLSVIMGVHERYVPQKHNPWNEVECGDHYARALASWGCLISLEGFHYDGPAGIIAFAPKMQSDNINAFFTAAKGWGNISQNRTHAKQINAIDVKYGHINLKKLSFEVKHQGVIDRISIKKGNDNFGLTFRQSDDKVVISLQSKCKIKANETLTVKMLLKPRS